MKILLWNYCDKVCGFYPLRFKFAAEALNLLGCDYWTNSIDYKELKK
jgi:hypothetical protein